MSKYDDLEKIQKLKDSGTLTDEEFEYEKEKILKNTNSKKNVIKDKSSKNYKKLLKVFFIIFFISLIITVINIINDININEKHTRISVSKGYSRDYYEEKIQDNLKEKFKDEEYNFDDLPRIEYEVGHKKKIMYVVTYIIGGIAIIALTGGIVCIIKNKSKED